MTTQRPKRVLYVQHAGALGGSCMSLLYTIQALDRARFEPIVAAIRPSEEVVSLYETAGIPTVRWFGIGTVEHTTAHWCAIHQPMCWSHQHDRWRHQQSWVHSSAELVRQVKPDLVHLNSVVLSPTARALHDLGVPFVWHVREHPVRGYFGVRREQIRRALRRWPREVIFISNADATAWLGGSRGVVIPNFVDLSHFAPTGQRAAARQTLGLDGDAPVVLYLGGLSEIKGVLVLLKALHLLRTRLPRMRCLMPASVYPPPASFASRLARAALPLLGSGTFGQRVDADIRRLGLENVCYRAPFQTDIRPFYEAADLVLFPATAPHFARPIVEAGAMGVPVVASRLDGAIELVEEGETGLLVPPGDADALARAVRELLDDPSRRSRMADRGRECAVARYDARRGIKRIEDVYSRIFDHGEFKDARTDNAEHA